MAKKKVEETTEVTQVEAGGDLGEYQAKPNGILYNVSQLFLGSVSSSEREAYEANPRKLARATATYLNNLTDDELAILL